jgi:fumarate hydratase subunit beta
MATNLKTPLSVEEVEKLRIGERVLLSGVIYGARDAAHKRLIESIKRGEELPFELEGSCIYYVGPAPAKPGEVIGPAGPTSSYRMDPYTLSLLERRVRGMIGKGSRGPKIREAIQKHKAVYFVVTGGASALIAQKIKSAKVIAYEDLGPEALRVLEVEDFPLIVANDTHGGDLFEEGIRKWEVR